jgi:hypothetical protein
MLSDQIILRPSQKMQAFLDKSRLGAGYNKGLRSIHEF